MGIFDQICDDSAEQKQPDCSFLHIIWNFIFGFLIFIAELLSCLVLLGILCYCIKTKFADAHIFLCTFGFHFLAVQAILNMNVMMNCENIIKAEQRLYAHSILQLLAIIFIVLGLIVVSIHPGFGSKSHGVLGLTATIGAMITVIIGVFSLILKRPLSYLHIFIGLITLILSSMSLVYGLDSPKFRENFTFGERKPWKWMIYTVIIYTMIISLLTIVKRCLGCDFPLREKKEKCEDEDICCDVSNCKNVESAESCPKSRGDEECCTQKIYLTRTARRC